MVATVVLETANGVPATLNTASPFTLDVETFQKLHTREYLRRFLSAGLRPDGRKADETRDTRVLLQSIASATASASAHLGSTSVICGIKAEVCQPAALAPSRGFIVPNVELSPLCHPMIRPGPPHEMATVISADLLSLFSDCDILDLEKLCISRGDAVWCLWVDFVVISYDGNLMDACLIALCGCLKDLALPAASYSDDGVVRADYKNLSPLKINHFPTSLTFGFFDSTFLTDPSHEETQYMSPLVNILVLHRASDNTVLLGGVKVHTGDDHSEINVTPGLLKTCISTAKSRNQEILALVGII